MQVHTFVAESAADAVAQIRAQLGPQAVVLNVRPLTGEGLSRLWQKRRIEVLACLPETAAPSLSLDALAELRQEVSAIRQRVESGTSPGSASRADLSSLDPGAVSEPADDPWPPCTSPRTVLDGRDGWRVGPFLENSGLLPIHAARVVEELRSAEGDQPPASFGRELDLARALLRRSWRQNADALPLNSGAHVLVGAPGVGKTVCLCKWLAQSVLVQGCQAAVWRLDGRTANTAEALSVYSEILGTPVARSIPDGGAGEDLLLIDLPGVNWTDRSALDHLARQIEQLPHPQVHLVLNAAYELPLLLGQARAFSTLPIVDLIITHLDEEPRWGKLWNLVLGTNFSIRLLSAGQNIPGDWSEASPEQIFTRQFPRK